MPYQIGTECECIHSRKHTTLEPTRRMPRYPLWPVYRDDGHLLAMFQDPQDARDWVAAREKERE